MTTPQEAAKTAKRLLGLYPEIQATDPKEFAAAVVQLLSCYPQSVLDRAIDPVFGIPAQVDRWNLSIATIKKHLDNWAAERAEKIEARMRAEQAKLEPPPPPSAESKARVAKLAKELAAQLKAGFSPSTASDFTSGVR